MTQLTTDELRRIRECHEAANYEPERDRPVDAPFTRDDLGATGVWYYVSDTTGYKVIACRDEETAEFIAAAHRDVPRLVDEVERLIAESDSAHRLLRSCHEHLVATKQERDKLAEALAGVRQFLRDHRQNQNGGLSPSAAKQLLDLAWFGEGES